VAVLTPEFDLIAHYFTRPTPGAILGVGDDCALLSVETGKELAVSTDTMVSGVHFLPNTDPRDLGHKALAVNLSDLAAMGAAPRWFTLALTLPEVDHSWLEPFSAGLLALADETGIELVGGDTTRGPLSMTLTVMGEVPAGKALRREGARAGDDVWVSGTLGDAALGLRCLQARVSLSEAQRVYCVSRLVRPTARLALGMRLLDLANSAIDLSDGLLADLGHICERSHLGARLELNAIPASSVMAEQSEAIRIECQLAGGDDYELCFTSPVNVRSKIAALSRDLALALTRVGIMTEGENVLVMDADGRPVVTERSGYDHFAAT
jgi:thiamine-monophosphate kinase